MPIMAIYRSAGVTAQDYAKFRAELPLSPAPAAGIFHAYGSDEDGLIVVDVWDDEAAMDRFIETRLRPALAKAGLPFVPPRKVQLHTVGVVEGAERFRIPAEPQAAPA